MTEDLQKRIQAALANPQNMGENSVGLHPLHPNFAAVPP
jgi:hypothetical protein